MANVTFVFPVDFLDIKGREDSAPESCPDSRGRSDYRDRRSWQTYSRRNSYGPRLPLCASLKVESVSEDVMEVVVGTGIWNLKTVSPLTQPWPEFAMWIVLSWIRESSHMSCMIDQCFCRMNLQRQQQCKNGYSTGYNGIGCYDVDECHLKSPFDINATCTNISGGSGPLNSGSEHLNVSAMSDSLEVAWSAMTSANA